MNDLIYKIALSKVDLLGHTNIKYLISYCGGAKAVFEQNLNALLKIPGIGERTAHNIVKANPEQLASDDLNYILKNNIKTLYYLDDDYPTRLKRYDDCPIILYYNGTANLNHHRIVSVVGTRRATQYGKMMCDKIIEGLIEYDVLIVSGLAFGIDTAAHRVSLKYNIPTVGVVAHGHDTLYPSQNKKLAEKMIVNGGVLTEFPINTIPARENFPMRNRIIAGMADVVVVVESGHRGGSKITAEFANNYNKDVFAVPGKVNDKYSVGCNELIKQHKAALIESAADIAYVMRWDVIDNPIPVQGNLFVDLDETEKEILEILIKNDGIDIDNINYHMHLQSSILASKLLNLEFKGKIKCMPGKKYMII